jgi:hypothetical protein
MIIKKFNFYLSYEVSTVLVFDVPPQGGVSMRGRW